jgi:hypothetical protein
MFKKNMNETNIKLDVINIVTNPLTESPSPLPLTPETQKYSIQYLSYAPISKPFQMKKIEKMKKLVL